MGHCYYTGEVRGRRHSTAAISTCNGIITSVNENTYDAIYSEIVAHTLKPGEHYAPYVEYIGRVEFQFRAD